MLLVLNIIKNNNDVAPERNWMLLRGFIAKAVNIYAIKTFTFCLLIILRSMLIL